MPSPQKGKHDGASYKEPPKASKKNPKGLKPASKKGGNSSPSLQKY